MKLIDEIKKFLKFNVVGIFNTLVDFLAYSALSALGLRIVIAQAISYALGMTTSYTLNSLWTFKDKKLGSRKIATFIIVNLITLGVSTVILYFYKAQWGLEGFFAKLAALPFSVAINFIGNRFFVFNGK